MNASRSHTFGFTDGVGYFGRLASVLGAWYVAYYPQIRAMCAPQRPVDRCANHTRVLSTYLPVSIWTVNFLPPSVMSVVYSTSPTSATDEVPVILALRARFELRRVRGLPWMPSRTAPANWHTRPSKKGVASSEGFMAVKQRGYQGATEENRSISMSAAAPWTRRWLWRWAWPYHGPGGCQNAGHSGPLRDSFRWSLFPTRK